MLRPGDASIPSNLLIMVCSPESFFMLHPGDAYYKNVQISEKILKLRGF